MFNEEFKMQYIKDDSSNKNFANFMPSLFETIAKYEEEYQKDLCCFNIEEIGCYFTGLSTSSVARCLNIRSQFIKYSVYCEERNMIDDHQIHWEEADKQFIINCINYGKQMEELVSRDEVLKTINGFPNPRDKFLPLAIFEGICGNRYRDFLNLTMRNFSEKNGKYTVRLENKTVEISKQLYYYAEEAAETFSLYSDGFPNGRKLFDENDKRIIKMSKRSFVDYDNQEMAYLHKISNMLSSIKNRTEKSFMSQSALVNSGRLYYINIHKPSNEDTFNYVSQNRELLSDLFGRIQTVEGIVNQYNIVYGENKE